MQKKLSTFFLLIVKSQPDTRWTSNIVSPIFFFILFYSTSQFANHAVATCTILCIYLLTTKRGIRSKLISKCTRLDLEPRCNRVPLFSADDPSSSPQTDRLLDFQSGLHTRSGPCPASRRGQTTMRTRIIPQY